MIAQSSKPKPATDNNPPAGSGCSAAGFFESGTNTRAAHEPDNDDRDVDEENRTPPEVRERKPPAIGPIAMPRPMVPAQAPMARAAPSGRRKTSLMIDNDAGIVSAAPIP